MESSGKLATYIESRYQNMIWISRLQNEDNYGFDLNVLNEIALALLEGFENVHTNAWLKKLLHRILRHCSRVEKITLEGCLVLPLEYFMCLDTILRAKQITELYIDIIERKLKS